VQKSVHSPQQQVLQRLLKQQRLSAGLRQADLASQLGVQRTFVSRVESGEVMMDLLQVRQYCSALGLRFPDFVAMLEEALAAISAQ